MPTTISSKGQITVPLAVRKALGLRAGTKLELRLRKDAEIILSKAAKESHFSKFKGMCRKGAPWQSGQEAVNKLRGSISAGDFQKLVVIAPSSVTR